MGRRFRFAMQRLASQLDRPGIWAVYHRLPERMTAEGGCPTPEEERMTAEGGCPTPEENMATGCCGSLAEVIKRLKGATGAPFG